jgi:hypothetical protein
MNSWVSQGYLASSALFICICYLYMYVDFIQCPYLHLSNCKIYVCVLVFRCTAPKFPMCGEEKLTHSKNLLMLPCVGGTRDENHGV